jgi:hypothetical protein
MNTYPNMYGASHTEELQRLTNSYTRKLRQAWNTHLIYATDEDIHNSSSSTVMNIQNQLGAAGSEQFENALVSKHS